MTEIEQVGLYVKSSDQNSSMFEQKLSTNVEDNFLNYLIRPENTLFKDSENLSSSSAVINKYFQKKTSILRYKARQRRLSNENRGQRNLLDGAQFFRLAGKITIEKAFVEKRLKYDDAVFEKTRIGVEAFPEEAPESRVDRQLQYREEYTYYIESSAVSMSTRYNILSKILNFLRSLISSSKIPTPLLLLLLLILYLSLLPSLVAKFKLGPDAWSGSDVTTALQRWTEDAAVGQGRRIIIFSRYKYSSSNKNKTRGEDPSCERDEAADRMLVEVSVELNHNDNESIERSYDTASDVADEAGVESDSLHDLCSVFVSTEQAENSSHADDDTVTTNITRTTEQV